jgi:hypothetical protein
MYIITSLSGYNKSNLKLYSSGGKAAYTNRQAIDQEPDDC